MKSWQGSRAIGTLMHFLAQKKRKKKDSIAILENSLEFSYKV